MNAKYVVFALNLSGSCGEDLINPHTINGRVRRNAACSKRFVLTPKALANSSPAPSLESVLDIVNVEGNILNAVAMNPDMSLGLARLVSTARSLD